MHAKSLIRPHRNRLPPTPTSKALTRCTHCRTCKKAYTQISQYVRGSWSTKNKLVLVYSIISMEINILDIIGHENKIVWAAGYRGRGHWWHLHTSNTYNLANRNITLQLKHARHKYLQKMDVSNQFRNKNTNAKALLLYKKKNKKTGKTKHFKNSEKYPAIVSCTNILHKRFSTEHL